MADRLYYNINEVAQMLGETVTTIRYWSDQFPTLVKPDRTSRQARLFRQKDIDALKRIQYQIRVKRLHLDAVKAAVRADNKEDKLLAAEQGLDPKQLALERLLRIEKELLELRSTLA